MNSLEKLKKLMEAHNRHGELTVEDDDYEGRYVLSDRHQCTIASSKAKNALARLALLSNSVPMLIEALEEMQEALEWISRNDRDDHDHIFGKIVYPNGRKADEALAKIRTLLKEPA
jgi:hypothetical protein